MKKRKGIILAGGSGVRLYPLTIAVSKQLLPVYDKPMIYYPLTVLMLAGIQNILIITTPTDLTQYQRKLGDGSQWGINLTYKIQANPDGLAQALILADEFLDGAPSTLILGDNIFFGSNLSEMMKIADAKKYGATIFGYHVSDPRRYGVIDFKKDGKINRLVEKPEVPPSNYAITGLYFFDDTAPDRAKHIKPSHRGELEITSLLETYLREDAIHVVKIGRGYTWLDAGTLESLLDASNFVKTHQSSQGLQIGSPEEVAYRLKWITKSQLKEQARRFRQNSYGQYLDSIG